MNGAAKNTSNVNNIQTLINETLLKNISTSAFIEEQIQVKVKNTINITCKRCGSDDIYVESRQVRASDEAMTKFYECLHCGSHWRVG